MLTDEIAKMIESMLEAGGGTLDLQRNEMAGRLGCVPSQISYVITSRFTPPFFFMLPKFIARSSHVHYSFSARWALVKLWSRTSAERVLHVRSVKAHAILVFPKRISYLAQTHL